MADSGDSLRANDENDLKLVRAKTVMYSEVGAANARLPAPWECDAPEVLRMPLRRGLQKQNSAECLQDDLSPR
ncbi:unnamed protein product, partial [Iphiclides podalirius]